MTWRTIERAATLAAYAVVIAVGVAYLLPEPSPRRPDREALVVEGWRELLGDGVVLAGDPATAEIVVLELLDFQCPYCARYRAVVGEQLADSAAVVLIHWPLSNHPQAEPAAVAFECAAEQGRAREMAEALFDGQQGLGVVPWVQFAEKAQVSDFVAFTECIARPVGSFARIARGREIAREVEAYGTPTVIVNGTRLATPPQSYAEIVAAAGGQR